MLTKFRNDWVKIEDFLLKAYFWISPDTPGTHCNFKKIWLYLILLAVHADFKAILFYTKQNSDVVFSHFYPRYN